MNSECRWAESSREMTLFAREIEESGLHSLVRADLDARLSQWSRGLAACQPHVNDARQLQRSVAVIKEALARNSAVLVSSELHRAAYAAGTPKDWFGPLFERFFATGSVI